MKKKDRKNTQIFTQGKTSSGGNTQALAFVFSQGLTGLPPQSKEVFERITEILI